MNVCIAIVLMVHLPSGPAEQHGATPARGAMSQEHAPKGSKKTQKPNLVITPGGPVQKDKVHEVPPGLAVRRNPDGTYTVVPKHGGA
jgi:hypothetical protein